MNNPNLTASRPAKKKTVKRYVKQYDDHSCGPIAIYNILVWAGFYVPARKIYETCNPTFENGTLHLRFTNALRQLIPDRLTYTFYLQPACNLILRLCQDGYAAIVCEHWDISHITAKEETFGEHYYCIVGYEAETDTFTVVNKDNKRIQQCNRAELQVSMRIHEIMDLNEPVDQPVVREDSLYPCVWVFSQIGSNHSR